MGDLLHIRRAPAPGLVLALALAACVCDARAAVQTELSPTLSLAAGADDNVLFDGRGGDQILRGGLRLQARAWERLWNVRGDVGLGLLSFRERRDLVLMGDSTLRGDWRFTRDTRLAGWARVRAADDPLALAQVGLLAAGAEAVGYRSHARVTHRFDRRWSGTATLTYDGVLVRGTPAAGASVREGSALGLAIGARYRLTRPLTLVPALEARTYFTASGVLANSLTGLTGVRFRLARRTYLEAVAGPMLYGDAQGSMVLGTARASLEREGRWFGATLSAAHDLTVPSSRGGVLASQLVEGVGRYGHPYWEARLRAGFYRSHPSPRDERWVPGYGFEAGAFRKVFRYAWVGVTAMRFERLATDHEPSMARDAIYLRLDLTDGRP